mmetsp:Transcript_93161/g.129374  ORF Transcript_93161/g.129374 Transcript_93161/m.129374 type:complete len:99 (+) Transcript_93161:78-374(+)
MSPSPPFTQSSSSSQPQLQEEEYLVQQYEEVQEEFSLEACTAPGAIRSWLQPGTSGFESRLPEAAKQPPTATTGTSCTPWTTSRGRGGTEAAGAWGLC